MTPPIITKLPKSQVELKFTVTPEEAKPYLEQAVIEISTARPIQGFRPGKASYEDVKRAYGEMAVLEASLERIIRARFVKALLDEQIESVGSPEIAVETLVPGQDIVFRTTVNVMPTVTDLADYSASLVTRASKVVGDKEVDHSIEELRKMRRKEAVVDRAAAKEDMVVIDLEIKKDHVVVEGGVSRDYRVFLNEEQYIPGFADKLVGIKKGDVRTFELEFPKDHYNKILAGFVVEFVATAKDVFELQLPEVNEEFAKGLGLESVEKLRELLRTNLQGEEDKRADESAEIQLLEKLVAGSKFTEIPDLLMNEEVRRMIAELQHSIEEQGMNLNDYLSSIKKTMDDLQLDFVKRAIERIKTAMIIRAVVEREHIEVSDEEVDAERDKILDSLKAEDTETRDRVISPEYHNYMTVQMKNRKALELLKEKAIS